MRTRGADVPFHILARWGPEEYMDHSDSVKRAA